MADIIVISDDGSDDGAPSSFSTSASHLDRPVGGNESPLFGTLGATFGYQQTKVKVEQEDISLEAIDQAMPDAATESEQKQHAALEQSALEMLDQLVPENGIHSEEGHEVPSEEVPSEVLDQLMPDAGLQSKAEQQNLLAEEASLFFSDKEHHEAEDPPPERANLPPQPGVEGTEHVRNETNSPLYNAQTTNSGQKNSSGGQFKLLGDVSDDEDDDIEDTAKTFNNQTTDKTTVPEEDENDDEYDRSFFGEDFGQDLDVAEEGNQSVEGQNEEAVGPIPDNDYDEAYASLESPANDGENQDEEESESEFEPDTDGENTLTTNTSRTKGQRNSKTKSKKKDPKDFKNPPTAREYFRRLREARGEKEAKLAGLKRNREPEKQSASKRKKSGKDTGWRDNKPCMRLADKLFETEDLQNAASEGSLPSLGSIKAHTHKSQFAQIKAKMPKDGDTRRASSQKRDLEMAVKSFGYKRMVAEDGKWRHKDMETGLFNYQVTLVSWMMERENSGSNPLGGLIGDEMGMGKTLVSLACAVGHPPEAEDIEEYSKATLVIVPNKMVARQWMDEIRKHCKEAIRALACIYKYSDESEPDLYEEKFFVLATYREVQQQHPGIARIQEWKEKYEDDRVSFNREFSKAAGNLFKVDWYRVILDEAHQIKNVRGQTSIACCDLSAKFHWCLSGTPLSNTPQEFYPYLKFLNCPFTDSSLNFYAKFVDGYRGKENFDALAGLLMYRRTKKDAFLGRKILDIPEMHTEDIWVTPTKEEQIIYDTVFEHYEKKISRIQREKDEKGYLTDKEKEELGIVRLAQYTRLRQTVSHIFGLEPFFRQTIKDTELEYLTEILKRGFGNKKVLDHLGEQESISSAYSLGLKKLREQKPNVFGGIFDLTSYLTISRNEVRLRTKDARCLICNKEGLPNEPIRGLCGHVYCMKCLCELLNSTHGQEIKCIHVECPEVLKAGGTIHLLEGIVADSKREKAYKEPGADSNEMRIGKKTESNGFYTATFFKPRNFKMPPSTKLTAAMAVILTWQENHPEDKILVFTQFILPGKVLGYMLSKIGVPFLYLYGSIDDRARKKAIDAFKSDPTQKIMIIGLKCGGQALNLTAANRVILIDPWWNNVQEQQAFARVWRHGQNKESHLVRIMSNTAVDKHIFDLQTDKASAVGYALQDDNHKPALLDDTKLEKLFAPVVRARPKGTKQKAKPRRPVVKNESD